MSRCLSSCFNRLESVTCFAGGAGLSCPNLFLIVAFPWLLFLSRPNYLSFTTSTLFLSSHHLIQITFLPGLASLPLTGRVSLSRGFISFCRHSLHPTFGGCSSLPLTAQVGRPRTASSCPPTTQPLNACIGSHSSLPHHHQLSRSGSPKATTSDHRYPGAIGEASEDTRVYHPAACIHSSPTTFLGSSHWTFWKFFGPRHNRQHVCKAELF